MLVRVGDARCIRIACLKNCQLACCRFSCCYWEEFVIKGMLLLCTRRVACWGPVGLCCCGYWSVGDGDGDGVGNGVGVGLCQ